MISRFGYRVLYNRQNLVPQNNPSRLAVAIIGAGQVGVREMKAADGGFKSDMDLCFEKFHNSNHSFRLAKASFLFFAELGLVLRSKIAIVLMAAPMEHAAKRRLKD